VLQRVVVALAFVLAAELVWFFGITPCLALADVDVAGLPGLGTEAVLAAAGIDDASSFISINAAAAERALEKLPQVESAKVVKRFPDRIRIVLEGRTAVALALAKVDGKTVPVYMDRHGVVFAVGASPQADAGPALPVLSGLVFENVVPGTRLPEPLVKLLADLDGIQRRSPALLNALSEIRIQSRPYDGFDLMLFPAQHPVRVKIGAELNEEVLRYMMLVLDVLSSKGIGADEIDFRTGTVSYRAKEASSG